MEEDQTKHYRTPELWLGAYLIIKGMILVTIEHTGDGHCEMVFVDSDERPKLVEQYIAREDAVPSAQEYVHTGFDLKRKIQIAKDNLRTDGNETDHTTTRRPHR